MTKDEHVTKQQQYQHYLELILKWSKSADITATTNPDEIRSKHFEDSRELIPFVKGASSLIDLGSGGGFPGLPIKIECPQIHVVLLDSKRKKVNFLKQAISELKLSNIEAFQGRAEDIEVVGHRVFDIVVSRATWPLKEYLKISFPYYDKGLCIAMKGPRFEEELKEAGDIIKKLNIELINTHNYNLSGGETRCLLIFKKHSKVIPAKAGIQNI